MIILGEVQCHKTIYAKKVWYRSFSQNFRPTFSFDTKIGGNFEVKLSTAVWFRISKI